MSLDLLDRKIIAALQINGRASWKELAQVLDASETTVIRRGKRLLGDGLIAVVGYVDVLRSGLGVPALVLLSVEPSARGNLQAIARAPEVRFASTVTGQADLVAELVVPSQQHLIRFLSESVPQIEGIKASESLPVMHTMLTTHPWEHDLLPPDARRALAGGTVGIVTERQWESRTPLDRLDFAILAILAKSGRAPAKVMARELGASESTVARRMERLVSQGSVGFFTVVPPTMLGFNTQLLVWLRVDSGHLAETTKMLIRHPVVKYLWITAGRHNVCASIHVRHMGELYTFETEVLGSLAGIQNVEINAHLQTLRRTWIDLTATGAPIDPAPAAHAIRRLADQAD